MSQRQTRLQPEPDKDRPKLRLRRVFKFSLDTPLQARYIAALLRLGEHSDADFVGLTVVIRRLGEAEALAVNNFDLADEIFQRPPDGRGANAEAKRKLIICNEFR